MRERVSLSRFIYEKALRTLNVEDVDNMLRNNTNYDYSSDPKGVVNARLSDSLEKHLSTYIDDNGGIMSQLMSKISQLRSIDLKTASLADKIVFGLTVKDLWSAFNVLDLPDPYFVALCIFTHHKPYMTLSLSGLISFTKFIDTRLNCTNVIIEAANQIYKFEVSKSSLYVTLATEIFMKGQVSGIIEELFLLFKPDVDPTNTKEE